MAEVIFKRTPYGMPLTDLSLRTINATIEDTKNHEQDAMKCLNCGIIVSSLLVPSGCINCGVKDLTTDINKTELL